MPSDTLVERPSRHRKRKRESEKPKRNKDSHMSGSKLCVITVCTPLKNGNYEFVLAMSMEKVPTFTVKKAKPDRTMAKLLTVTKLLLGKVFGKFAN